MGFFDGIKKLTQPFEDDDDFYDDDEASTPLPVEDQQDPPAPEKKSSFFSAGSSEAPSAPAAAPAPRTRREARENKVVDLGSSGQQMKVVLVSPENFDAAAEIADQLREKRPVLMNLEKTPKDIARRLIDFLSGVAYALEGKIKRVASNTYIITPYNVDIMGDGSEPESSELYF